MSVTAASFRTNFPAFASTTDYPDAMINFWLDLGGRLLDQNRWGDLYDYGEQLFMAHNLSLERGVALGGTKQAPGQVNGPQTAGAVDKVSYSRNPGLVMDPKNGHWNLTIYGLRYIQLVKMIGAGPIQVGVSNSESNYGGSSAAWPGVSFPFSS